MGQGMARGDELAEFVRSGLLAGRDRAELASTLETAGWGRPEIDTALGSWMSGPPGLPPVPRPRPYVSAREALVYGLLFLGLAAICWHATMLGFGLIDRLLPDGVDVFVPFTGRWNMAVLIIAVPLFLLLNRRVARASAADRGARRSVVRRWFAAVTVGLATLALLGNLVSVVYALLDGGLTARFAAKAGLVGVIAALAFLYWQEALDVR